MNEHIVDLGNFASFIVDWVNSRVRRISVELPIEHSIGSGHIARIPSYRGTESAYCDPPTLPQIL